MPPGFSPARTTALKPPGGEGASLASVGRKVLHQVIGRVNTSGTTNTSDTVVAKMLNPSSRLRGIIEAFFVADTQQLVNDYQSPSWVLRALRPPGNGYREAELHVVENGLALPRAYEIDSLVRAMRISATITIPLTPAAASIAGNWVISATWEPNTPMCDDEVLELYDKCGLELVTKQTEPLAP